MNLIRSPSLFLWNLMVNLLSLFKLSNQKKRLLSETLKMVQMLKCWHFWPKDFRAWLRRSGSKWSSYKDKKDNQKGCFNCKKPGHLIAYCPDLQKNKSKKESSKKENFIRRVKKNLMPTWEDLDNETNEEETNLALMASTSSDVESKVDYE